MLSHFTVCDQCNKIRCIIPYLPFSSTHDATFSSEKSTGLLPPDPPRPLKPDQPTIPDHGASVHTLDDEHVFNVGNPSLESIKIGLLKYVLMAAIVGDLYIYIA